MDIDFENPGSWPLALRVIAGVAVYLVISAAGYFLIVPDKLARIKNLTGQIKLVKSDFRSKFNKASNLEGYQKQLVEMEETYKIFLQQLPRQAATPELLEEITRQAFASSLTISAVQPGEPANKGFYFEQPYSIDALGSYHGIGEFISNLSNMPRIMSFHDFELNARDRVNGGTDDLILKIDAKSYWDVSGEVF